MSVLKKLAIAKAKLKIRGKYKRRFGFSPNFKNPQTFTEKIQYRKLYDHNPLFSVCSDKYQVRRWVAERIGEDYLIPLHYVGDSLSVEVLKSMPDQFVVKTNHDSGGVWVVKDKAKMNTDEILKGVEQHLAQDFGKKVVEPWYSSIPRKVIIEGFLDNPGKELPEDYKFHVFKSKGKTRLILQIDFERESKSKHHRTFYDEQLKVLPFTWSDRNHFVELESLQNFELMKELALTLSADFNYARVDFYNIAGKIYFGEITFAPASGLRPFPERKYDFELGSYWELESTTKRGS